MINRDHVRVVSATLTGIASLCFPACGPEDTKDSEPPPVVDPARNPQEHPAARAAHEGLAGGQPDPAEQVWKVADPTAPAGDHREPTCVLPSAAAALPSTATAADHLGTMLEPPPVCRIGTSGLVPITSLPPPGDNDHVQVAHQH
jgi:hypothetical protein